MSNNSISLSQYGMTMDSLASLLQRVKGGTGPMPSIPSNGLPASVPPPAELASGLFPLLLNAYSQSAVNALTNYCPQPLPAFGMPSTTSTGNLMPSTAPLAPSYTPTPLPGFATPTTTANPNAYSAQPPIPAFQAMPPPPLTPPPLPGFQARPINVNDTSKSPVGIVKENFLATPTPKKAVNVMLSSKSTPVKITPREPKFLSASKKLAASPKQPVASPKLVKAIQSKEEDESDEDKENLQARAKACFECALGGGKKICTKCHHYLKSHKKNGTHVCQLNPDHTLEECPTKYKLGHEKQDKAKMKKLFKSNLLNDTTISGRLQKAESDEERMTIVDQELKSKYEEKTGKRNYVSAFRDTDSPFPAIESLTSEQKRSLIEKHGQYVKKLI